jgi:hypothetical protein
VGEGEGEGEGCIDLTDSGLRGKTRKEAHFNPLTISIANRINLHLALGGSFDSTPP